MVNPLHAQEKVVSLKKEVMLKPRLVKLAFYIQQVSLQTGIIFSYNPKKINLQQNVILKNGMMKLPEVLNLLKEKGFSIKLVDNYVILSKASLNKNGNNNVDKIVSIQTSVRNEPENNLGKGAIINRNKKKPMVESQSSLNETGLIIKPNHTIDYQPIPISKGITSLSLDFSIKRPIVSNLTSSSGMKQVTVPLKKKPPYFINLGILVDESTFCGVTSQIGTPSIYGTLSINTDFKVSQFRYGLGSSLKVAKNLRLHLTANRGSQQKSFTNELTTLQVASITAKNQLTRFGISAEFSLSKKMGLLVGPFFNYLETNYFVTYNVANAYQAPYISYTLMNPYYSNGDSNIKTWLGFQASFIYKFTF